MDKIYDKVWKLLAAPERWTKNAFARDVDGYLVHPSAPQAVSWCIYGAAFKVYGDQGTAKLDPIARRYGPSLDFWNDCKVTHANLVNICKEADI